MKLIKTHHLVKQVPQGRKFNVLISTLGEYLATFNSFATGKKMTAVGKFLS